jgi:pimeloyl-ACP methyl ester carboxylesterase
MKRLNTFAAGILAGVAGTLAAQTAVRYRRDMRAATARLLAGSRMIETVCGPMEYAAVGDGPPLMCIHGVSGGYDVPFAIYPLLDGLRLISPSRPGYLHTSLAVGRTPQEQADSYAALLDALAVERVAIAGASGGGPSTLHFALRHPDRCFALIMVSAVSHSLPAYSPSAQLANVLLRNYDFPAWWLTTHASKWVMVRTGITPEVLARIERDPQTAAIVRALIRTFPVSARRAGLDNDLLQGPRYLPVTGLERITAPTLVIHGDLDPVVPISHGEYAAQSIPNAVFLRIADGGHLCMVTHKETTFAALNEFVKRHAPGDRSPRLKQGKCATPSRAPREQGRGKAHWRKP